MNFRTEGARKAYAKALEAYRFLSFNLAVEHLDKAIGKSPEYAEAWFLKAQIFQEVEHPDLEVVLSHALGLDATRFPHGWVELARVQWELGKYEQGLASLERMQALGIFGLTGETEAKRRWVEAGLQFSAKAMASVQHLEPDGPDCLNEADSLS